MEDEHPITQFLVLGTQALVFAEKVNAELPITNEMIDAEAKPLSEEIFARAKGNRHGQSVMRDKDLVTMIEAFIRIAYHRLKLSDTE